jgi:hypothetical protein
MNKSTKNGMKNQKVLVVFYTKFPAGCHSTAEGNKVKLTQKIMKSSL